MTRQNMGRTDGLVQGHASHWHCPLPSPGRLILCTSRGAGMRSPCSALATMPPHPSSFMHRNEEGSWADPRGQAWPLPQGRYGLRHPGGPSWLHVATFRHGPQRGHYPGSLSLSPRPGVWARRWFLTTRPLRLCAPRPTPSPGPQLRRRRRSRTRCSGGVNGTNVPSQGAGEESSLLRPPATARALGLEGREAWRPTEKALRGTGAMTQACRSLLTRGPREFLAQAALCVEDSYRRRQTAPFTDICQPPSQPGSWVSTGRRRPVSGHQATPEGQALLTQCRAGHRLPRDPVSVCTGGRRPRCAHAAPASLPPSLAPSFFPSLLLSLPPSLAPSLPPAGVKASFPPQTCALQQDFNGY